MEASLGGLASWTFFSLKLKKWVSFYPPSEERVTILSTV